MRSTIILMTLFALALTVGCSGEDKDAATDAAANMKHEAGDMMKQAGDSAGSMAQNTQERAKEATATVAGSAVAACQKFAETGAWEQALDACTKAHEMMPDDLALEHAYQQALAASGQ